MSEVRFSVPGEPVAWARPRFNWRGAKVRGYSQPNADVRKHEIGWAAKNEWRKPMMYVPVVVGFAHFRSRPKKPLSGYSEYPTQKPDLDNYDKLVLDALEGIVYSNDSQVVGTMGWPAHGKHYAGGQDDPEGEKGQPRTEVVVMPLEEFRATVAAWEN